MVNINAILGTYQGRVCEGEYEYTNDLRVLSSCNGNSVKMQSFVQIMINELNHAQEHQHHRHVLSFDI